MPTFKAEEQLFTNKSNWTTTEMQEWIESEYGDSLEKAIGALEQLKVDIENKVIKTTTWDYFNIVSAKAYANKHPMFRVIETRYTNEKVMVICVDRKEHELIREWHVDDLLRQLNNRTLESRFATLSKDYKAREEDWAKKNADKLYFNENRSRIYNGELCYAYLRELELSAVSHVDISNNYFGNGFDTTCYDSRVNYRAHCHIDQNRHGELTYNGEVVPEDKVIELLELTKEFSSKTIALAKEHERLMNQILKGGEK